MLLPLGWPPLAEECEAFTRVLLAAGADVERMLDPAIGSVDAFVRHASRLPFLRSGRERTIVAFAPVEVDVDPILEIRHRLINAVEPLRDATWLVYLSHSIRSDFLRSAHRYGGLFDAGAGLTTWHINCGAVGLVGGDTWLAGLSQRLEELLDPGLESGVMPVEAPYAMHAPSGHVPTTEPAPPMEGHSFEEGSPYAAVASRASSPSPRNYNPDPPRPSSSVPPNPRLRRR